MKSLLHISVLLCGVLFMCAGNSSDCMMYSLALDSIMANESISNRNAIAVCDSTIDFHTFYTTNGTQIQLNPDFNSFNLIEPNTYNRCLHNLNQKNREGVKYVLFFSKIQKNILYGEIIKISFQSPYDVFNYDFMTMFGESMLYRMEFSDTGSINNIQKTKIHYM